MDWAARYSDRDTPWDLGRAHPELVARLASGALGAPARVLVPGCGRGHDALALAKAGWRVTAVDLVALPGTAQERLADHRGRFLQADVLAFDDERAYDLVFDHTLFCAIDPGDRARWGAMVERALVAGGRVASLVFPVGRPADLGGPPWNMETADVARALPGCEPLADEPVAHRAPGRNWDERWALFERRGP